MVKRSQEFHPPPASYQERPGSRDFYPTIIEASQAAQRLDIKTLNEYAVRYDDDPRLPSNPDKYYGRAAWTKIGRWVGFLGKKSRTDKYRTFHETKAAVARLGIRTMEEYFERYREDPRLRARPDIWFKDVWAGQGKWRGLLGRI